MKPVSVTLSISQQRQRKDAFMRCRIERWDEKPVLILSISREGPKLPPIHYSDIKIVASGEGGRRLETPQRNKEEVLVEIGDQRGTTAQATYDITSALSFPVTVAVTKDGSEDVFLLESK